MGGSQNSAGFRYSMYVRQLSLMRIASYKEASGLMEDHHYLEQITGMYVSTHPGLNFFRQIFKFSLFCLNTFTKKEKTMC